MVDPPLPATSASYPKRRSETTTEWEASNGLPTAISAPLYFMKYSSDIWFGRGHVVSRIRMGEESSLFKLHLLHLLHLPKLSGDRSSFGSGCTFERSFLHRFCTFCTACPIFGCSRRLLAVKGTRYITTRDSVRAGASTCLRCRLGESMSRMVAVYGCSGQGWG